MSSQETHATASIEPNEVPLSRYAVIDLAVAEHLRAPLTDKRNAAMEPLFSWKFAKKLLEVGPWLVSLSDAPELESALADYGDDVPWGYYVNSPVDILSLRKSLRRYNRVRIPNTPREVLFRYWDPRVMVTFLRVTTEFQSERLFEWIDHIEIGGKRFYRKSSTQPKGGGAI